MRAVELLDQSTPRQFVASCREDAGGCRSACGVAAQQPAEGDGVFAGVALEHDFRVVGHGVSPLGWDHLSDKIRRPDCSRPFSWKPFQSVTSWSHTKRGGSLAPRTRYVFPSNRL